MVVVDILEQLLDEVNVGHDHASAAVALQAKLVHRVAKQIRRQFKVLLKTFSRYSALPISLSRVSNQLEVAFPKVASDLQQLTIVRAKTLSF